MRIDACLSTKRLDRIPDRVRALERAGFDGAFTVEDDHEPFSALLVAARASQRLELSTAVASASASEEAGLALVGRQLHVHSGGRFRMGLAHRPRAHIVDVEEGATGELAMGASDASPDQGMRRLVLGLKARWAAWDDRDAGVEVGGRYGSPPPLVPASGGGPVPVGGPPVLVRSHGPRMAEMAAQVADGVVLSPFHTPRFLSETTLPAIERGRGRRSGGERPFDLVCQVLLVTGNDADERAAATAIARRQVAWAAATTAQRGVLEAEGWSALADELSALAEEGRLADMAARVDDEVLDRVAVRGEPEEIADRIRERYSGRATRIALRTPQVLSSEAEGRLLDSFLSEWEVDPAAS